MAAVEGEGSFDVARFLKLIHPNTKGQCYEVRILNSPDRVGGTFLKTYYGYFVDHAKAAAEIARFERFRPPAIYLTVNPIDPSLYGRAADRLVAAKKGEATSDNFAIVRHLLFIDIDPKRPSGISATEEELALATQTANAMRDWLAEHGWQIFIEGMSGNGRYLLYRINLPNNTESYDLISRLYTALKQKFETAGVSIDESNKNAARIMKVLGTMARKGDDVKGLEGVDDRPHRRSWYIAHESASLVAKESIEAIAAPPTVAMSISKASTASDESVYGPIDNEPWMEDSYKGKFDLEQWIKDRNVPVSGPMDWPGSPGGRRWKWIEPCPLCGDHGADIVSPFITQRGDGRIIAGCRHERCKFTWRDLRTHYEPDAYSRRESAPVTHTASGVPLYVHEPSSGTGGSVASHGGNTEQDADQYAKQTSKARGKKEEAAERHREKRDWLRKVVSNWEVVCIAGSSLTYRFTGEFFRHASTTFEVPGEEMRSFAKFQSRLQSMAKTGLHPSFAEVWEEVIVDVVKASPIIESDPEGDQRRMVAAQMWPYLIDRTLEFQLYIETWSQASSSYFGVLAYADRRKSEYLLLIDYVKLCEVFSRDLGSKFDAINLRHALHLCGATPKRMHSRKHRFNQRLWAIDKESMRAIGRFGQVADEETILYMSNLVWVKMGDVPPENFKIISDEDDRPVLESDMMHETGFGDVSFNPDEFDTAS